MRCPGWTSGTAVPHRFIRSIDYTGPHIAFTFACEKKAAVSMGAPFRHLLPWSPRQWLTFTIKLLAPQALRCDTCDRPQGVTTMIGRVRGGYL